MHMMSRAELAFGLSASIFDDMVHSCLAFSSTVDYGIEFQDIIRICLSKSLVIILKHYELKLLPSGV